MTSILETNLKFAKVNIYACDFARSYDCVKDPSRLLDWLMHEYLTFCVRSTQKFCWFVSTFYKLTFLRHTFSLHLYLLRPSTSIFLTHSNSEGLGFWNENLVSSWICFPQTVGRFSIEKGHLSARYKLENSIKWLS